MTADQARVGGANRVSGGRSDPPPLTSEADGLLQGARVEPKPPYADRRDDLKIQRLREEHELRKRVSKWVYIGTAAQVAIADLLFFLYAGIGVSWNLPVAAVSAWLGSTVAQVIAVLLVITRYLFPSRKQR